MLDSMETIVLAPAHNYMNRRNSISLTSHLCCISPTTSPLATLHSVICNVYTFTQATNTTSSQYALHLVCIYTFAVNITLNLSCVLVPAQ